MLKIINLVPETTNIYTSFIEKDGKKWQAGTYLWFEATSRKIFGDTTTLIDQVRKPVVIATFDGMERDIDLTVNITWNLYVDHSNNLTMMWFAQANVKGYSDAESKGFNPSGDTVYANSILVGETRAFDLKVGEGKCLVSISDTNKPSEANYNLNVTWTKVTVDGAIRYLCTMAVDRGAANMLPGFTDPISYGNQFWYTTDTVDVENATLAAQSAADSAAQAVKIADDIKASIDSININGLISI